jgi:hypothetical protein
MQWRRSGGNLIAIYIVGTIILGWFLNWFLGNFFYNTLWTIIGGHFGYKEADLISYFLGNFIPFVLAAGIVAVIYIALRYELKQTNNHLPQAPEALKAVSSGGAALPSPQVPASPPSNMPLKGDNVHPLAELDPYRLFAIDREKGTVWLKFLPDGKNDPQQALELILFGNQLLLELDRTPLDVADYAIQKSNVPLPLIYDVPPATQRADSPAERAAGDGIGSRIIREGLAEGRSLRLNPDFYESTAETAADLIRRALTRFPFRSRFGKLP